MEKSNFKKEISEAGLEGIILSLLLLAMLVVSSMQIIWRYVFQISLAWSEEVARYLFVWSVWIGAAYASKMSRHIRITFLKEAFPEHWGRFFDTISALVTILFCGLLCWLSLKITYIIAVNEQQSPALQLPMWIPYMAVPAGTALMAFRTLQTLAELYRKRRISL